MVFVASITTRKKNLEPCQVSLEPGTVLPRIFDIQNCISKNNLKRVSPEFSTWKILALRLGLSLIALMVICLVLLTVIIARKSDLATSEPSLPTNKIPAYIFPRMINSVTRVKDRRTTKLKIVEREEWGAMLPAEPLAKLELPVPYVIVTHVAVDFCYTTWDCGSRLRDTQEFDIKNLTQGDIRYNFMIGGNGYAYVGRGWDFMGPDAQLYNTKSISISLIGNFSDTKPPTRRQILAAARLIELGVKRRKIQPDYILLVDQQTHPNIVEDY